MASNTRRARRQTRKTELAAIDMLPHSLVAASTNVRVTSGYQNVRWGGTDWQQELWLHYDTCPEFHAGVNLGANNLSRARLIGVEIDPLTGEMGTQPSTDPDVVDIMGQLFGGPSGQSQALSAMYKHLDVAGDCWELATDSPDLDGSTWETLATTEVTSAGNGRAMVQQLNGLPRRIDDEHELLIRIWQSHPKDRWDADSPARALLPVLRELAALTAMVSATVKSRLASAGILWLPEEMVLPTPRVSSPNNNTQVRSATSGADAWLTLITEGMTAPIRDPDSAAAVVPIISLVKGEHIDKIKHMEFGRDLDAMIEPLREMCVKRLAIGMNLPPEQLLGMGDVNHWTAWSITEDYAKAYLAPKLELISDALTREYLREALRMRGRDPKQFAVYFDIMALVPRQISVDNAKIAHDAGLLSDEDFMAELGFAPTQIAGAPERARRLLTGLLMSGTPFAAPDLLSLMGFLFPGVLPPSATLPIPGAGSAAGDGTVEPAAAETATAQSPPAITAGPPTKVERVSVGAGAPTP